MIEKICLPCPFCGNDYIKTESECKIITEGRIVGYARVYYGDNICEANVESVGKGIAAIPKKKK